MGEHSKVLNKYFYRRDTVVVKKLSSCSAPKVTEYHLSEPMKPIDNENFERCCGVIENSLEDIANSVVNSLFLKDNRAYVNEKIILYRSLNHEVKGKPYILVNRETAVVNGASSDTDELLILQKLIEDKISKKLQQN